MKLRSIWKRMLVGEGTENCKTDYKFQPSDGQFLIGWLINFNWLITMICSWSKHITITLTEFDAERYMPIPLH